MCHILRGEVYNTQILVLTVSHIHTTLKGDESVGSAVPWCSLEVCRLFCSYMRVLARVSNFYNGGQYCLHRRFAALCF